VDFRLLDGEKDMLEMVKHLVGHKDVAGHVYVGTIQGKKLQALCYWVCDCQNCGQAIDHNDWDQVAVQDTIEMMCIEKGQDTGNVLLSDLGKFDPDDFETDETAFINLLVQMYGANKKVLSILYMHLLLLLHLLMKPKGICFSYPKQVEHVRRTTRLFTIC
jgi:hypothetical protein